MNPCCSAASNYRSLVSTQLPVQLCDRVGSALGSSSSSSDVAPDYTWNVRISDRHKARLARLSTNSKHLVVLHLRHKALPGTTAGHGKVTAVVR